MLTIFNKKTKQIIEYDYEDIYEGMSEKNKNVFLKNLYDDNKAGRIASYCSCVPDKRIPLVISKNKQTYYIKRQSVGIEHSPSCKFDGNYEWSKTGWAMDDKGVVRVNLLSRMHSLNEYVNPNIEGPLSLKGFTSRFLGYTWEIQTKHAIQYDRPPMKFERYFHSIYHIAKKIWLSDSTNVNDIMGYSKTKAYELLKRSQKMFVMLIFDGKENYDDNYYKINLKNPGQDYKIELICLKTKWDNEYESLSVNKDPLLVSGFVELKKNTPLIFKHVCILPLSLNGALVRTNNERTLANRLHLKNRHFVFSYETFKGLGKYQPDLLIMDEKPKKVIEILEEKDNLDYMQYKDKKIEYFKRVSDFEVQIWDAIRNERIYFI